MTTVLVTGPIGGGKSTVCKYLLSKGYPVYDCDSRCKRLYEEVPGLKSRIETELGIAFSDLALIFDDEALRQKLEAMVYPLLLEDIKAWQEAARSDVAFIESAIAMDKACFDGVYQKVLLVTASKRLRHSRNRFARKRDSLQSFDLARVDAVIKNNASVEQLYRQVENFLETKI